MADFDNDDAPGRRGPRPTGKGAPVLVRLQPELLDALDRFIDDAAPGASRPEALRRAFRRWATDSGYLASEQEGIRPEDLNAANDD